MSTHFYLFCEATRECVEAVACVGTKREGRIQPNALSAFLAYHSEVAPGASLRIANIDSLPGDPMLCGSLADLEEERERFGFIPGTHPPEPVPGYVPPVLTWDEENYHELLGRRPHILEDAQKIERLVGPWVRRDRA